MSAANLRPLSIYVHYSYCSKICTFCNFNKYRLPPDLDLGPLLQNYRTELGYNLRRYKKISNNRTIRSVYFGGGTPSLSPTIVSAVLLEARQQGFSVNNDTEVTLEANPTSLPDIQFLGDLGVTRVSLGVQSLVNDEQLRRFNREHTACQSQIALDRLVRGRKLLSHGFSFDLMFGNPLLSKSETPKPQISSELELALPYAKVGGHLSLYELSVEKGTPLSKQVKEGDTIMPDPDSSADEYDLAVSSMIANGFDHYEISSFALPGRQSKHNFSFWMHEDLIGIGPGAHGRISDSQGFKWRTRCVPEPTRWSQQVRNLGHGQARVDSLGASFVDECIALGLRTMYGVSSSKFKESTGHELKDCLDMKMVRELEQQDLVTWSDVGYAASSAPLEWQHAFASGGLRATERGRSLLDLITPMLLKG